MAQRTSRSNRDDVLQFLDSLDAYSGTPPKPSATSSSAQPSSSLPRSTSSSTLPSSASAAAKSDSSTAGRATASPAKAAPSNAAEAQSVLDFLDEITQRSSTPSSRPSTEARALEKKTSIPSGLSRSTSRTNLGAVPVRSSAGGAGGEAAPRKSTDSARSVRSVAAGGASGASPKPAAPSASAPPTAAAAPAAPEPAQQQAGGGGWGWSSMWNQASSVVQQASHLAAQAKTAAEEQVKAAQESAAAAGGIQGIGGGLMKALGENEQAKKWGETVAGYAKGAHLDQIGKDLKSSTLKSLTDLLNAVAPPIAEHEVIQVSLSHDMVGYDGVETLVYRGLAKIMDQIEGGTLIVNKGNEEKPREQADEDFRDLNVVDGLTEGWKLAEASLDQLIKATYQPPASPSSSSTDGLTVPVTTCPIYMRIQPVLAPLPFLPSTLLNPAHTTPDAQKSLFFLLVLRDPTHNLVHSSLSQAMPATWLEIPFEENEWVEDAMVEVIRRSVETVGQDYITLRMRAQSNAISAARAEALKALDSHQEKEQEEQRQQQEAEASTAAQEARVGVV
ncbi:hypothetical protein JCM8547_002211 [Rhodosporidiobolus lusitaniae]